MSVNHHNPRERNEHDCNGYLDDGGGRGADHLNLYRDPVVAAGATEMNDLTNFIALLESTGQFTQLQRLNIYDGDIELSLPITDMLSMHRVNITFRFSRGGDNLKWIDAEVRS